MTKILLIDDDVDMCLLLSRFLKRNGYEVETAHSATKGLQKFDEESFALVFCDFRLGDKDGKEVLTEIKAKSPETVFIIITGYSDIKIAVDVIKLGAYDYITKPLIPDEVLSVIQAALNEPKLAYQAPTTAKDRTSAAAPPKKPGVKPILGEYLVGKDARTIELYRQIDIVAPTNYSVILYGESGTGKEVIAKTIHENSERKNKPFIAMDCGTLNKELAGSELFGHVKGAFTGALTDKEGHFELANGGTLFLDEVANLSYDVQASLLRVIQERKYKRVGGNKESAVDIRVIVASNENLQAAYKLGKFREDLYHRFNEFSINLPPLRERKKDIPLFAEFFLQKTKNELNKDVDGFDAEVMDMFVSYSWPGNLREFRNVVRRSVLLTTDGLVKANTLPWEITNADRSSTTTMRELIPETKKVEVADMKEEQRDPVPVDLKSSASKAEYEAIMKVLQEVNFNKTKAAEILNIDRKTLYNKIKGYGELTK